MISICIHFKAKNYLCRFVKIPSSMKKICFLAALITLFFGCDSSLLGSDWRMSWQKLFSPPSKSWYEDCLGDIVAAGFLFWQINQKSPGTLALVSQKCGLELLDCRHASPQVLHHLSHQARMK